MTKGFYPILKVGKAFINGNFMSVCAKNIRESLQYLLYKLGGSQHKIKLIKLLFFADKYHYIQYGRTVTNDKLFAMRRGPVGSRAKSILDPMYLDLDNVHVCEDSFFFALDDKPIEVESLKYLSSTDKEALDFAIDNFGEMNNKQIENATHNYQEWKRYEDAFENGFTKREDIFFEDLLSYFPGGPFEQFSEQIRLQQDLLED